MKKDLTKREYFAMNFLKSILTNPKYKDPEYTQEDKVKYAVQYADKLINTLERINKPEFPKDTIG